MAFKSIAVELRAEVAGYMAGMTRAAAATRSLGDDVERTARVHGAKMEKVGRGALLAGGAVAAGLGVAVAAAAGFEKAMSGVAAATGAGAAQMGKLRQAALDAGAATVFSASDAARAQTELAKAGLSTADILGGALRGSLDLAAAAQLDLARAAEISAAAMTVFKLKGTDVGHIADVLAAGAGKSLGSVDDLSMALSQGGLVASQFGLSLEETTGVLALFAKAGLQGSDAGTSMKTLLQRLVPQSKEAEAAMRDLGLEFFDASGRFLGISHAAEELRDSLGRLPDARRLDALTTIFGSDAIRGAGILLEAGAKGVDTWAAAVDDAGYAADQARKQLDNLAGDVEALQGSLETALIKSGSGANTVLREMAQLATGAVNAFSGLPGPVQGGATAFAAVTSTALLAAGAAGTLIPKITATRDALNGMGAAGVLAGRGLGFLGKAAGYGVGVAALAGAVSALSDQVLRWQHGAAPNIHEMTNALVRLGKEGRIGGELATEFGGDLDDLAGKLEVLQTKGRSGGVAGNVSWLFTKSRVDDAKRDIDAVDKSLADLVRLGHVARAADIFKVLDDSARAGGASAGELKGRLDDYRGALANLDTENQLAGRSTGGLADAVNTLVGATGKALVTEDQLRAKMAETAEATEAAKKAHDERIKALQGSFSAFSQPVETFQQTGNLAAFTKQLLDDQRKARDFQADLIAIARRAGPDIARFLEDKGPAAAGLAAQLAGANARAFTTSVEAIRGSIALESTKTAEAFDQSLEVLPQLAETAGTRTADALVKGFRAGKIELSAAVDEARRIIASLDPSVGFIAAVRAESAAISVPMPPPPASRSRGSYHSGGLVAGRSREVLSLVEPGEFVIRKEAVAHIGVPQLQQLNRYHQGGYVGTTSTQPVPAHRDSALLAALDRLDRRLAAMPGHSTHSTTRQYNFGPIHGLTLAEVEAAAERKARVASLMGEGA